MLEKSFSLECRALYEMNGLQYVVKGTRYPAVMYVAEWSDPLVTVWQVCGCHANGFAYGRPRIDEGKLL